MRSISYGTFSWPRYIMQWLPVLIVCLVASCRDGVYAKELGSWCNATARGGVGSVTCHFTQDLNAQRLDFTIQHTSPNSSALNPVLSCTWQSDTLYPCYLRQGYTFDETVSDQLKVIIPNATSTYHDGKYVCQVVSNPDGDLFMPCELFLAGIPDPPSELQIMSTTLESITVCWKAPPEEREQVSHRIRYKPATTEIEDEEVDVYPPGATCFSVSGLTPGTGYKISVLALNKYGMSEYQTLGKIANTSDFLREPQYENGEVAVWKGTSIILVVVFACLFVVTGGLLVFVVYPDCRKRLCYVSSHCIKPKRETSDGGSDSVPSASCSSGIGSSESGPHGDNKGVTSVQMERTGRDSQSDASGESGCPDDAKEVTSVHAERKADTSDISGHRSSESRDSDVVLREKPQQCKRKVDKIVSSSGSRSSNESTNDQTRLVTLDTCA